MSQPATTPSSSCPSFLGKNLAAMFALTPDITTKPPYLRISTHGMSLVVTTPALVYLLWPRERQGAPDVLWYRALWCTVAACALPGLFYQNTACIYRGCTLVVRFISSKLFGQVGYLSEDFFLEKHKFGYKIGTST